MKILGKEGLRDLDFNVSKGKVTAQQAAMLNEVEEEIPSVSDVVRQVTWSSKKLQRVWRIRSLRLKTSRQIQMIYSNILCENF